MEFLKVDSIEAAREKLLSSVGGWMARQEVLPPGQAPGRILAQDIFAREDIPAFRRSTVDGYAVLSKDTAAASDSIPVFLAVKGQVEMGLPALFAIENGECAEVPTGAMLPGGADAVVMIEYAEKFGTDGVAVYSGVSHGENVVQIGEDAKSGELLLHRGKQILPQDIGVFAAAGVSGVPVFAPLRVTIISTGDEIIPPGQAPQPGQVRDINTGALSALAQKNGFEVVGTAVLPDDETALEQALRAAMQTSDVAIASGGSSQGKKDMTKTLIDRVAAPGVYTHGLAVKPGKPTILGVDSASQTLLVGLPGHPVSAMIVFELLLGWLLREITGSQGPPAIPARMSCNVACAPGKTTCWPVKLHWTGDGYEAQPVFGKSGLITTLAKADGYITVGRDTEGLNAGQTVLVQMF